MPFLLTYASRRVAALPPAPVMPTITFLSFFSRHAMVMAARSIMRILVLMPTAWRYAARASPMDAYGGHGYRSPASKPFGYPASARRRLARVGSYGSGSNQRENSRGRGISEPVGLEKPRVSAWLRASRSMARLAACRTRRSAHGDFGSH